MNIKGRTQFPLEISQENRELWIESPERIEEAKVRMYDYLEEHSFPWLSLLVALGCGALSWLIYLTKEQWRESIASFSLLSKPPTLSPWERLIFDFNALHSQYIEYKREGKASELSASLNCSALSSLLRRAIARRSRLLWFLGDI